MIYVLLLYVSIAAHELGHYVAYRTLGYPIERVAAGLLVPILWWTDKRGTQWSLRLIPLGGYVRMPEWVSEHMSASARAYTAAAGPLVTLILASLALTAYTVVQSEPLLWLAYLNATAAVFNLLPFPPLDGGHILLAWLQRRNGRSWLKARETAFFVVGLGAVIGLTGVILSSGWEMVPKSPASAIEARSDATPKSGAARKGESAAPKGGRP
jgi:membrane-associated protease RseP (regulator of RpoE activity)